MKDIKSSPSIEASKYEDVGEGYLLLGLVIVKLVGPESFDRVHRHFLPVLILLNIHQYLCELKGV